jgi:hypothetical protein
MKIKKVIIRIKSFGIGNILFQLAAANKVAKEINGEVLIDIYDNVGGQLSTEINFSEKLELINNLSKIIGFNAKIASKLDIFLASWLILRGSRIGRIWERVLKKTGIKIAGYIEDNENFEYKEIKSTCSVYYLDGYFQNINYTKEINCNLNPKIWDEKYLKDIVLKIESTQSVSIHIRRGDYLDLGFYENHGMDFTKKCINEIKNYIKRPNFFIFTDDPVWVKENIAFITDQYLIVSDSSMAAYDDFQLMIKCKHNIISNSTFSWWAAYLNKNKNKIIIAPKKWLQRQEDEVFSLVLPNWIAI